MTHEQLILSVLTTEAKHTDVIAKEAGLSIRDTATALSYLLLDGKITAEPGFRYKKEGDTAKT